MKTSVLPRLVLVAALIVSVLPQARAGVAQTPEPSLTYEQALARLDQLVAAAEDLRALIDRTQFDLEALSLELGFGAPEVVAFVRDQIAFEQYAGLLRGARGTLIGRAGNALDQAVLLTTLLAYAGYEARIVRGELSPEQAQALVEQMAVPHPPKPPIGDLEAIRTILTEIGRVGGLPDEEIARQIDEALNPPAIESTETYRAAQADTAFILTKLQEAGVELGDPNAMADLIDEARDYFWVEHRLGPSDPWEPSHPAFGSAPAPQDIVPIEFWTDVQAIPVELQHHFRFQVFIEQWVKGELIEHPVMSAWEAPVADLVGAPVTFHNHLDGMSDTPDAFDLETAIEGTELFIPMVNDAFPTDLRVFDLTGTPTEFEEIAPNEYAAQFELGELIGTGPDGVDLFGTPDPGGETPPALTAQWIDYTLIAPDGLETTYRRSILDRIGSDNRVAGRIQVTGSDDEGAVKAALFQQHAIAVAAGDVSPALVLDMALQRFIAGRPIMGIALRRDYFPGKPVQFPDTPDQSGSRWADYLAIYSAFDEGARLEPNATTYRHAPSLVVYRMGSIAGVADDAELTVQRSIDIVNNARRAVSVADRDIEQAAEHLVWTGVWETHAESLALANQLDLKSFSTMAALERAATDATEIQVVTSEADLVSSGLALTTDAMSNLRADLANGYVAIVPSAMPPGEAMTGWWRVNPRTGETLGITSDGRGAATDYVVLTTVFLGMYFGVADAALCAQLAKVRGKDPGKEAVKCYLGTVVGSLAVLGGKQAGILAVAMGYIFLNIEAAWP